MKYEYGVEYACNGKKPDLPDDVVVDVRYSRGGSWFGNELGSLVSWLNVMAFRIVDERYKPKPEDNTWHERGELPSAGTECEYTIGDNFGGYKQCCFVGFNSRGSLVIELLDGELKSFRKHQIKFRPIRTEREKAIEAAVDCIPEIDGVRTIAGRLYDAGLLRLPEGK